MNTSVYQHIAQLVLAIDNCKEKGNKIWEDNHTETIDSIVKKSLPCGGGFDCGTEFNFSESKPDRLVFTTSYHHMNENGMYSGWTEHKVIITPSLAFDFDIRITGKDRNDIKTYMVDIYDAALRELSPLRG